MKIIEIVVSSTGQATVTTSGFAGSSCRQASHFIEQALGQSIGERLTEEFYRVESSTEQHQEHPL